MIDIRMQMTANVIVPRAGQSRSILTRHPETLQTLYPLPYPVAKYAKSFNKHKNAFIAILRTSSNTYPIASGILSKQNAGTPT